MQPFKSGPLGIEFEKRREEITNYILSMSDEDIMSEQDERIINNMYEKYKYIPLKIKEEREDLRSISKTKIESYNSFSRTLNRYGYDEPESFFVDGVTVGSVFPFEGDRDLFFYQAGTFPGSRMPEMTIEGGVIKLNASGTLAEMDNEKNKDKLFNKIKADIETIKKFMEYVNKDVIQFNSSIKNFTTKKIEERKKTANQFANISKMLEISIEKKNPNLIEEIKVERKIIPLESQTTGEKSYGISDENYCDILEVINHHCMTWERTPKVYSKLEEEELRDIVLATLNGYFKGKANGECFRGIGKTDISIEYENRAAFITECKFWKGKQSLIDAISQLESYTTWRDNKLCLLMFSKRNKDFFKVIEETKETLQNFDRKIYFEEKSKNEMEFIIKASTSEGLNLNVRIFLFNIYIKN